MRRRASRVAEWTETETQRKEGGQVEERSTRRQEGYKIKCYNYEVKCHLTCVYTKPKKVYSILTSFNVCSYALVVDILPNWIVDMGTRKHSTRSSQIYGFSLDSNKHLVY